MQARALYSQERDSDRELTVVFADLNTHQPEKADPISVLSLMFWPRQIYDAANDSRLVLHREMIELAQRNLNASFSLLRRLAGARSLGEMAEVQAAHFSTQLAASIGQSEELATLSIKTALNFIRNAYPS